jgi:hypothetical protein
MRFSKKAVWTLAGGAFFWLCLAVPPSSEAESGGDCPAIVQSITDDRGAVGGWALPDWSGGTRAWFAAKSDKLLEMASLAAKKREFDLSYDLRKVAYYVPDGFQKTERYLVVSGRPGWRLMAKVSEAAYVGLADADRLANALERGVNPEEWRREQARRALSHVYMSCAGVGGGQPTADKHSLQELFDKPVLICRGSQPAANGTAVVITYLARKKDGERASDFFSVEYWLEKEPSPEAGFALKRAFNSRLLWSMRGARAARSLPQSWCAWHNAICGALFAAWTPSTEGQATVKVSVSASGQLKGQVRQLVAGKSVGASLVEALDRLRGSPLLAFPPDSKETEISFEFNAAASLEDGELAVWDQMVYGRVKPMRFVPLSKEPILVVE